MKFNIKKECPRCNHIQGFDFTICPSCGRKYRNIRSKTRLKNMQNNWMG